MKKRDLGKQKPREKPKTQKNNLEWTYPRFFSQDCFFCFFRFPQFFAQLGLGTPKNLAKNGENRGTPKNFEKNKKTKNNLEWTYPRFFSQDCFFLVFLDFLDNWGWGHQKTSKNKTKKTI